jgi:hypothetical protein
VKRAGALLLLLASCSLIVDTENRTQCQTTADCDANPALAGRVCKLGFCAAKETQVGPVNTDAGEGCSTTEICTAKNSGRASVCKRPGTPCVPWVSDDACPYITGDWKNPDALMIGSLIPLTIRQAQGASNVELPYSQRLMRAIDLAVDEVAQKAVLGFFVGNEHRPLAVLHCDSQGKPEIARALFTHLTDVVGAPAVIVGWSEDLDAIASVPRANEKTIVCSDCLAPAPPGLKPWHILPSLQADAALVAWRVAELEKELGAGTLKVGVLIDGAGPQKFFAEQLDLVLRFNGGKSPSENGPTNYRLFQTEDPRKNTIPYDDWAGRIAEFAPDVLVVGMATDFPERHLPRIEARWPTDKPRPRYVLTQISYDAAPFDEQVKDDALRRRISGTHPFTTPELAKNIAGFEARYLGVQKERANGNFSGYEAFYSLALAIGANSGQPVFDSARISLGFNSLVAGDPFDLGPANLSVALDALAAEKKLDIRGLYTDLDWNLETREVTSDMGMFCFTRADESAPLALHDVDGVRWSATTKQVIGTYACP